MDACPALLVLTSAAPTTLKLSLRQLWEQTGRFLATACASMLKLWRWRRHYMWPERASSGVKLNRTQVFKGCICFTTAQYNMAEGTDSTRSCGLYCCTVALSPHLQFYWLHSWPWGKARMLCRTRAIQWQKYACHIYLRWYYTAFLECPALWEW